MTFTLRVPDQQDLKPRIIVFGVGGAGGNAVDNMIIKNLEGANFVVANTDAQALQQSSAQKKIQMVDANVLVLGLTVFYGHLLREPQLLLK